jgi:hypothetical protein
LEAQHAAAGERDVAAGKRGEDGAFLDQALSQEDRQLLRLEKSKPLLERMRLTNRTYHFAAEFAEVGR